MTDTPTDTTFERAALVAHYDLQRASYQLEADEVFQRQLVAVADYYSAQIRAAQAVIDDLQPKLDTLRFLDPPSLDLEYLGVFRGTR